jgi:hypothetical protein
MLEDGRTTETCSSISSIIVKLTYDSCVDGYKNPHHLITDATGCKHPRLSEETKRGKTYTSFKSSYFRNSFFVTLQTSLAWMFIYCRTYPLLKL